MHGYYLLGPAGSSGSQETSILSNYCILTGCSRPSLFVELRRSPRLGGSRQAETGARSTQDARAGEVPVDHASGRNRVHNEHAETGKPLRSEQSAQIALENSGYSGPAPVDHAARLGNSPAVERPRSCRSVRWTLGLVPLNDGRPQTLCFRITDRKARSAFGQVTAASHRPGGAGTGARTAQTGYAQVIPPAHSSHPPVLARIHPPCRGPSRQRHRAERYDGKRDLYFQHAA